MNSNSAFADAAGGNDEHPMFSVVIPTYNRVEALKRALRGWEKQVPPEITFEVVVIDDGSEDETAQFLDSYAPSRYSVQRDSQPNSGPAAARNRGLRIAEGTYVLFTGDDIEPAAGLLDRHLQSHRRFGDPRYAVLGRIEWSPDLDLTSTMCHVDGVGAQQFSYHSMKDGSSYDFRHFYTSNVSVSRRLLDKEPSGFSTDFSSAAFEDAEFAYRLRRHGLRIVYQASAGAWHHHPYDVRSFFRRQVSCGEMAAVLIRKWPRTRSLLGADAVGRERRRLRFALPPARRRLASVAKHLDDLELLAMDLASAFENPATPVVDPLLRGMFQYAYLKGLSSATVRPAVAERLHSSLFLGEVGGGVRKLVDRLGETAVDMRSDFLRPLLEPFRVWKILGEYGD